MPTVVEMWVPRNAADVEEAVNSGSLEETASFDGKESLPSQKRNVDLAIDVAAMTTEGGVLLYGVGEDEQGRLTLRRPIPLAGVADRIDQIVATSIAEVPYIEVKEHPVASGDIGFVSVLVPQSPRAPHQVIVGDDKRFYGRGAKGNRRLGEGEVARLYQRRLEWQQDLDALLEDAIHRARFPPHSELAYLHGFARPVAPERLIWERAIATAGGLLELKNALRSAAAQAVAHSLLPGVAPNWRQQDADEWLFSTLSGTDPVDDPDLADRAMDIGVNRDGRAYVFFGRAGARANSGSIAIYESAIAGAFASFLAVIGKLYELGTYHGHVDLGVGVTGIEGGLSVSRLNVYPRANPYRSDAYLRTAGFSAAELLESRGVASRMLRDLFAATTGRDEYDPFED
jgi:hypothetical protein